MADYFLHEDRFFDSDEKTRKFARAIYDEIKLLPVVSPHGHVDAALFADNKPFQDPAELFIKPDHYLFRMLYSQGVPLEDLGIMPLDGSTYEKDSRKIWNTFCRNYYLFSGTPTGVWLDFELHILLGIQQRPNNENSDSIYDEISEKLKSPEFLPRALYEQFNIEFLATTDIATDTLTCHQRIKQSGWKGTVVPSFRPDTITDISKPGWKNAISELSMVTGITITRFKQYLDAIRKQRMFFKTMGATATDHGVFIPLTRRLQDKDIEDIFSRALSGSLQKEDALLFNAHMLMEHAEMSMSDGLVMQIHPGCFRNHNTSLGAKFGADKGHDIPVSVEFTHNLHDLLSTYGNNPDLSIIIFTLDEATYSRELAPLAGHYPALKLGPPWWFHDSINGMTRFRQHTSETVGFYNTAGFNDDTRALLSIPARHDVARRMDANYLAGLVAKNIISIDDAFQIGKDLTYTLVKHAYRIS